MIKSKPVLLLAAVVLATGTGSALAKKSRLVAHHRVHHRFVNNGYYAPQYESALPYYRYSQQPAPGPFVPSADDYSPGAIVARATIRAQAAPGLANELAPYAAQTATGGPVGGVLQPGSGR